MRSDTIREAARAAVSALDDRHWQADALVHVGGVDVATVGRRMGMPRAAVLEMLAQVTAARWLSEDAASAIASDANADSI